MDQDAEELDDGPNISSERRMKTPVQRRKGRRTFTSRSRPPREALSSSCRMTMETAFTLTRSGRSREHAHHRPSDAQAELA